MKFAIALLATLVLSGSARTIDRSKPQQGFGKLEQQWAQSVPEINNPKIQERVFKDGNEYRYLYDGQILNGIPDINNQYSGARIRAIVKIQLGSPKDLLQVEKVFVGSLHERFVSDPHVMVPLDVFEQIPEQDAPFEEALKKPVRFTYENGKIRDFEVTEDDPSWSINMKRAILSTFHLSLTDREMPEEQLRRPNPQVNEVRSAKGPQGSGPKDTEEYFTVMEDGIGGRCLTSYVVVQQPDAPEYTYPIYETTEGTPKTAGQANWNVLNITKMYNHRDCEYRPFNFKGLHMTGPCEHCEYDPESFFDLLESAAHTRYNITGTKDAYIIDSAITEAVYKVTPRSHYAGSIVSYANLTFVLIYSGPAASPISFPEQNVNQIDGLHMVDAKYTKKQGEDYLYETPEASRPILQRPKYWPNVANKPQKVRTLFEKLVQGMNQKELNSDAVELIIEIRRLMTYSETAELDEIYGQIKGITAPGVEKEEIDHIFADLLVSTGTECSFVYLKRLITEGKLTGPVVNDVFALLPLKMDADEVDQSLIEKMADLCQNDKVESSTFIKRSCWLAFGTLVHRACAHNTFDARVAWKAVEGKYNGQPGSQKMRAPRAIPSPNGEEHENLRCPVEFRQRIAQKIADKLKNTDEEQKILIIKVLGNMGLKETIDELETIVEDQQVPIYIRTQAIYALRHVAPVQPEEVTNILLPLYRKTYYPTQLRIAAFTILLVTKPQLPVLEDVAQSLNREHDLDVASFVYTSLSSLANSTDPCLKNLTRDAQLALEFAAPVNADMRHSSVYHGGDYSWPLKSGIFWEFSKVMDADAPVYKSAYFKLRANVMEKSVDIFEATFETEGFGDAIRRFVGNYTTENFAEVLSGRSPRRPRQAADVSAPEDITEINRLLNIKPKEPKTPRGTAAIRILGQETRFAVINPQTISRFLVELMTQSTEMMPKLMGEGLPLDQRRALLLLNTRLEFPSVLGVPIISSIKLPVFGGMRGNLKVAMEPKPEMGLGMFKQIPKTLTIKSDVKTQLAAELHAKVSVYLAFLKVGAGIRTRVSVNLPMDGQLDFNLADRMTKWTMNLPENQINLVKMESYPVTFVTKFSRNDVTYQPKNIEKRPQLGPISGAEEESEEITSRPTGRTPTQRYLSLYIQPVQTEFVTEDGHVQFPRLRGVPAPIPELWEIPSPDFVKSRQINFTVGHEAMAYELEFDGKCEYPDTRLPSQWLPTLAAKQEMELRLVPKKGTKKIVVTIYERSQFGLQGDQQLLSKLQDKVTGLTVKDVTKPNTPKDYERFPKLGHSLQILVNSEGSESPEAWTSRGLLALLYTVDGRYVKTYASMESKVPIFAKKICLAGELRYPDRNGMWFLTPQQPLNKSIQGNIEWYWGDECGADKYVKVRLRVQKTEEQRDVEKRDLYDITGVPIPTEVAHETTQGDNLFTPLFKECQKDRSRGAFFSKDCVDFAIRYNDLHRLKVDVEYKSLPRATRRVLYRFEDMLKGMFPWNTDVEDIDVSNPQNKFNAVVEVSADRSYVDVRYHTPTQNVNMTNIDMPFNVRPANALFPWTPARLFGMTQFPTCTLTGPKIRTFDDVDDEQPLSGSCWHVLLKDNSADDLFAVLAANVNKNSIAKKVAVLFKGGHRIEIVPKPGYQPPTDVNQEIPITNYIVRYNGQEMPEALSPNKRTVIPPNTAQDMQEVADVMLVGPESSGAKSPVVGILSMPTGLMVLFDGSSITVIPTPFWKGSLVGLCGPYSGQPWDDFLLPNKTYVEDSEDLARAFMIPKAGCDTQIL